MLDSFQISRVYEIIACLTHFFFQWQFKFTSHILQCLKNVTECQKRLIAFIPEESYITPLIHLRIPCYILKRCHFLAFLLSFCLSLFLCCYKFHLQWKKKFFLFFFFFFFCFNSQDHKVSVWLYTWLYMHTSSSNVSSCHTVDDNETCLPWSLLVMDNLCNICNTHTSSNTLYLRSFWRWNRQMDGHRYDNLIYILFENL